MTTQLLLRRASCGKVTTLGELFFDGEFECFILEDADLKLENDPSAKVYGQTCIPRGKYQLVITESNRFKRRLPLLLKVPGYEGVRIHKGNTHLDTDGCLLPGTSFSATRDGVHVVNNSGVAFDRLFAKLEAALVKGEVWLEVI